MTKKITHVSKVI